MIRLEYVYILAGLLFGVTAVLEFRDHANPKRLRKTVFWGIYSITFLFGSVLPPLMTGCLVILMVLVTGWKDLGYSKVETAAEPQRRQSAARLKDKLFIPALCIPFVTFLGTLVLPKIVIAGHPLTTDKNATLVGLGLSAVVAFIVALWLFRQKFASGLHEGRRLLTAVGTVTVLPQLLAALGALFAAAGVGQVVSGLVTDFIPADAKFLVVAAFAVGMALFTMIMGNAFAAFPVMVAGVGLPLIVHRLGGDPAVMAAIGMLSGYCGTLMTPMAANFNIVPAALLELPDQNGVVKVQIPTGLILLAVNILLMYFLVFRF
ncbi:MAG: DUF979 domain-containing protein [Gammaproteobacteria bacterium]|nr:DUF979 family protein [Gammaproteobacteria bacterium]MBU6509841.1 DUF979 family protein [Gammaproteobacteria bacterium]MDE1983641.1 DUF979 domain-containing protein [Gammaproteobacteria bacterium]MDE2108589.1 DUF979 domain-containing protein [Gammaproteobacteria bacterium]MDE2459969.1 DUF979 domain-containing protein [Gammaproteobacteria bacterium]